MTNRIRCSEKADREQLALILIKNGYTVRIGSTKVKDKNVYHVEYSENTARMEVKADE